MMVLHKEGVCWAVCGHSLTQPMSGVLSGTREGGTREDKRSLVLKFFKSIRRSLGFQQT